MRFFLYFVACLTNHCHMLFYNCHHVSLLSPLLILTHMSACAPFPGGLGAVRRRLRRVVSPGVRGRVVRDGRERRLHLRGLLPEGGRGERGRRRVDCGGGCRGERRRAGDVNVQRRQRAESAIVICCRHVVSSKPSIFTSAATAAARASAGQLALKKKTQPRTEFEYCTSHNEHNTKT